MLSVLWGKLLARPKLIAAITLALVILALYTGFWYYKHTTADLRQVVDHQKAEIQQAGQAITASSEHQTRIAKITARTRATVQAIQEATQGGETPPALSSEAGQVKYDDSQPKECPPCPQGGREDNEKVIGLLNHIVADFNGMRP